MRYFYKKNGEVYELFEDQLFLVDDSFTQMTELEVDQHLNPEKYLSDEEKAHLNRQNMQTLSPIDFDIKLNDAGLYDAVQELIKDNFNLRIAYTRATYFSRTDPFIIALGLTDEQVDELWIA